MNFEHILYDVDGPVATITLNRPDALNAFTRTMQSELIDAYGRADEDDTVRAVIVTGAGRAFCAGADLSQRGATFDYDKRDNALASKAHRDGGGLVALRTFESKKPIIGAINGAAVGVGATMTLPMDVRIASDGARFGFVFARRGVVPEACSSWFLPRVVGISQALEWACSGRVFPASEAHEGGLVKEVVPGDRLLARAREIAEGFATGTSAVSVALARQMMWRMLGADHPMEAHRLDSTLMKQTGSSADAKEGIDAFLEKRAARFPLSPSNGMPDHYPWWEEREFDADRTS